MFDKRHYGTFLIHDNVLESFPDCLQMDLFGRMIIVRAEHLYAQNAICYTAWSPEFFRDVPIGEVIPTYMAVISEGDIQMKENK